MSSIGQQAQAKIFDLIASKIGDLLAAELEIPIAGALMTGLMNRLWPSSGADITCCFIAERPRKAKTTGSGVRNARAFSSSGPTGRLVPPAKIISLMVRQTIRCFCRFRRLRTACRSRGSAIPRVCGRCVPSVLRCFSRGIPLFQSVPRTGFRMR